MSEPDSDRKPSELRSEFELQTRYRSRTPTPRRSRSRSSELAIPTPLESEPRPNHHCLSSPFTLKHNSPPEHIGNYETPWIIDTGATDHMVCSTSYLDELAPCTQTFVQLPNGTKAQVTHIGTVRLSDFLILTGVLCVPSFTFNLISVSKLTQKPDISLFFSNNLCFIQVLSTWMMIGLAKVHNGLYHLLPPSHDSNNNPSLAFLNQARVNQAVVQQDLIYGILD
ncbi:hypothetical protein I3842_14G086500 [Carya illinoinensis]|uniref:Retrovirus-related Pol polyprotein from transposon TNT 1-94-like beta-barrel domain-containing protein n=1 Tax=Carya illinoinensis TaxID=32201 RepID=A0A922AKK1_CARIL|nr:hypothetical protein I3842_14G086500 [Carya illinoinensis]